MNNGANSPVEAPREAPARVDQRPAPQLTLMQMAMNAGVELFVGQDCPGQAFTNVPVGKTSVTFRIGDPRLGDWLVQLFYTALGESPAPATIKAAVRTMRAKAIHDGRVEPVAVRNAEINGRLYVDLGDESGQAVEVDSDGWRLIQPPVRFLRPPGQLPLPVPERGGSLAEWRALVNIKEDNFWILWVTCALGMFRPSLPNPILVVQGMQGSAKTSGSRQLRSLTDPNDTPLRSAPYTERDLIISAMNCSVLAFDNLSSVPTWLSDGLCRMVTGSGYSIRKLFSDTAEIRMNVRRSVVINGIDSITTRSDFLDRTVTVVMPVIPDDERRCEDDIETEFEKRRPRIFGAMLDTLSATLRNLPSVKPTRLPRMADFAKFGTAAETAMGFPKGSFMAAYDQDRMAVHNTALEPSPIVPLLLREAKAHGGVWTGVSRELLKALAIGTKAEDRRQSCGWPTDPGKLTAQLKRLVPNLRATGLEVTFGRHTKAGNQVTIKVCPGASSPSVTGPSPVKEGEIADKQGVRVTGDAGDADTAQIISSRTHPSGSEDAAA